MPKHAISNGRLVDETGAVVPVTLREAQSNFCVYEALRVVGGHAAHLSDHIARLEGSASQIGLRLPEADWASWLKTLLDADGILDATVRITVYGGPEPLSFITWQPLLTYPDSYYDEGVAVTTYSGERFLPKCKTGNLLLNYLALEDAKGKGAFEALLVDRDGLVREGTRSNFYFYSGGKVFTAPDDLVLSGVTRISVLRALSEMNVPVVMEAPKAADLMKEGSTLFISSTSMAAMPVSSLDGKKIPCDFAFVKEIRDRVRLWEAED